MLKDDFKGTGNMKRFCEESNKLFSALNNIQFKMPTGYVGIAPTARVEDARIVLDMGQALIFTLNNVEWDLTGSATFNSYSAQVVNGQLVISVDAD